MSNPDSGSLIAARFKHRLIPAVPVPFNDRGELDEALQRDYIRWMGTQPVGAVAVWAHTGRGLLLNEETRGCVLEAWREGAGGIPIVCGVGVPQSAVLPVDHRARTDAVINATVHLAEEARRGGAAALLVHPPSALRDMPDIDRRCLELHRVTTGAGLPVIAFDLYQAAGGISYAPDTVEQILDVDGVIGIKIATLDSVVRFQELASVVRNNTGALLVTGEDRFLGYSLMLGADCALIGMGSACTDVIASLLDAWYARDFARFVQLSAAVDRFARATFVDPMDGYIQRMLWALEADDVLASAIDHFGPPLAGAEHDRVRRAVRTLRGL